MSDLLFTCPDCAHENFTAKGLKAHRGNKTCLNRQAERSAVALEVIPVPIDCPGGEMVRGDLVGLGSALIVSDAPVVMMSESDARRATGNVRTMLEQIDATSTVARRVLYDIQSREGWKALGYRDFVTYAKAEFAISKTHTYRLVNAGKLELLLHGEEILTQSEVAELSRLPDELVATVWQQANGDGKRPKPADLKNWVNIALGVKPKTKRSNRAPKSHVGQSVQVILKPVLGTSEVKWKPKAAESVTVILHLNRDGSLPDLVGKLGKIREQAEKAVTDFYTQHAGTPAGFAETLSDERTDY